MTATKVLPEREAAEVRRRFVAYCQELKPTGEVGEAIVMRAAVNSTRMERCVEYENAVLTEQVRRAEADFLPPEGVDIATADKLREDAGKRALFDDSPKATLARKYEASAERGFFRCLKELRIHEKAVKAAEDAELEAKLGSFLQTDMTDEEFDKFYAEEMAARANTPVTPPPPGNLGDLEKRVDVPISIGKRR